VLAALVALVLVALASCSNGGSSNDPKLPEPNDKTWLDWNKDAARRGFTPEANQVAARVAADIAKGGVTCTKYADTTFDVIATSYYKVGIPIPVGSGECVGPGTGDEAENILIEVMGTERPTGEDLVAFKRDLLCQQAKDAGRRPDGTSDFPGIPYVLAADETFVVQPDSFETNRQIAKALGLASRDMCEGIK
jgi:hypothetical protein